MSYPLDFAHYSLEYSDGNRSNKHYNVSLVVAPNGSAIIVRRWGKIGQLGDMKIEKFAIQKKAESEFDKLVQSKLGKGYETKNTNIKQVNSEPELRMAFGPSVWPMIPGPALQHIVPSMNVTGRKEELNPPRFEENGKFIPTAPKVFSEEEIRAAKLAEKVIEQEEAVKTYASNPMFGRF
jgi:predicted DNA-binding WGR domain protein